jgi:hypothetical protein
MIAFTVLLSILAWAMLSTAMPKHGSAILKRELSEAGQRSLRWAGMLLLLIGFYVSIIEAGWEIGPVYWVGIIMMTALLWVLVLVAVMSLRNWKNG